MGIVERVFLRKPFPRMALCRGRLLPYKPSVIFLDSIHISMCSVQTAVFPDKACFGLHLVLRQGNWKRSSGTRSSKCSSQREKSQKIWLICSSHGGIEDLVSFRVQEFSPEMKRLWRIWPDTSLFAPPPLKRGDLYPQTIKSDLPIKRRQEGEGLRRP